MENQKKYEVFVGSTKKDLSRAREAVIRAILDAGHIPSGMELWSAGTKPTKEAILERLQSCDIHIVLLGARYGYVPIDSKRSITEWEFDMSVEVNRPIIAFFLDDTSFKKELEKISKSKDKKDEDEKERKQQLIGFRKKVMESRICREFRPTPSGIHDLKASCINAVNEVIDSLSPMREAGWIRANSKYGRALNDIHDNWFLNRILNKLQEFNWLREGVTRHKDEKDALGFVFWQQMEGKLKRKKIKDIFFESGSTLAFITKQFETNVLRHTDDYKWRVTTNNVVILQELLLHTDIEVAPLPPGRPTNQFGGMYTRELLKNPEPPPASPRRLYKHENEAISDLVERFKRDSKVRLFLISASGWVLLCDNPQFRGINAETHPDMLFKRAVLKTGQPVVCFLTSDKIGSCFKTGAHFPIFGSDFEQDKILVQKPIAICISQINNGDEEIPRKHREDSTEPGGGMPQLLKYLEQLNFNTEYVHESLNDGMISVRIIANRKFIELFSSNK